MGTAWRKWAVVAAVIAIVAVAAVAIGRDRYKKSAVARNLRMLQAAWLLYGDLHTGHEPKSVADVLSDFQVSPDHVLTNPFTGASEAHLYGVYDSLPRETPRTLFSCYDSNGWYVVREDGTIFWKDD